MESWFAKNAEMLAYPDIILPFINFMYFWSIIPNLHKMNKDYIARDIQDLLIEASQYFSVICITGPRQSGKSTILKKMFPQAVKYSLKDMNVREFALNDPIAFLNQTQEMMFIDEAQRHRNSSNTYRE